MNALDIPRRLFLGTAVGALALRPSRVAQADTAFTNFSFAAAGAPAARTMPERLSDIINVKDWGAKGNGIGDDTTAIQNAIDYCLSTAGGKQPGGKVFFPPGTYKVSSGGLAVGHASTDAGVQLIGSGYSATTLLGPGTGFTISDGGRNVDCLELVSDMQVSGTGASNGGAIQITRTGASCINLHIQGYFGIDASACTRAYISGVFADVSDSLSGQSAATATTHGFAGQGTIGIQGNDGAYISDCRVTGYDIAYALKGSGATMACCTGEVNNIGMRLGWSNAGAGIANGCSVLSFQGERTSIPVELYDAHGCYLVGLNFGQTTTPPASAAASASWSSGSVTVTTAGGHNIGANGTQIVLNIGITSAWLPAGNNYILVTVTSSTQFTYALVSNPGSSPVSCDWTYPQQYAIRLRKASECVISAFVHSSTAPAHGSVDLDFGTVFRSVSDASNVQIRNVVFENIDAKCGWVTPVTKRNLAGIKALNCTGTAGLNLQVTATAMPILTYADLPGQTGVFQTGPLEGQTYSISDGNSSTFGSTQTGGGSGHYLVRYDGSNWVRIG